MNAHVRGAVVDAPLSSVRPNGWNPNEVEPHKMASIRRGFETVGWLRSHALLVWRTDDNGTERNLIIDGEHRWRIATECGIASGPMVFLDGISEASARKLTAQLDQARGRWNPDKLENLLRWIRDADKLAGQFESVEDLAEELGFKERELLKMFAGPGPGGDDIPPPVAKEAASRQGDVYELGPHRLVCGDSTDPETWRALMMSDRAQMIWTDPPYGVAYSGGHAAPRRAIMNDSLNREDLEELLRKAVRNAIANAVPGAAFYCASPAGTLIHSFQGVLLELGIWKHTLVWVKDTLVLGHSDYHYRHEPILYGWVPGAPHYFTPERDKTSVFDVARPRASEEHPTMKPIELVAGHVRNSSKPGWIVADPFGGSGTTLVAAASEGRVARVIELDPIYCDVIRRRWTRHAIASNVEPGSGALE